MIANVRQLYLVVGFGTRYVVGSLVLELVEEEKEERFQTEFLNHSSKNKPCKKGTVTVAVPLSLFVLFLMGKDHQTLKKVHFWVSINLLKPLLVSIH